MLINSDGYFGCVNLHMKYIKAVFINNCAKVVPVLTVVWEQTPMSSQQLDVPVPLPIHFTCSLKDTLQWKIYYVERYITLYNAHYLLYHVECASVELSHLNPMKREVSEPLQEIGFYLTYRDPINLTIKYEMKCLKMTACTEWRKERENNYTIE